MASIARRNLFEDPVRFLVAQAGIMFAVSLVTIQIGILRGFSRSTAVLIDHSRADLWISSNEMVYFELTSPMPAEYLSVADKVAGVDRAEVLLLRAGRWRDNTGKLAPVRIFGFNPQGQLFAGWRMSQGNVTALSQPYTILIDPNSRKSFGMNAIGDTGSIAALPARLVGFASDTQSSSSSAFAFASLETANAYGSAELNSSINCTRNANGNLDCTNQFKNKPLGQKLGETPIPRRLNQSDPLTYILIKAKPGENLETLRAQLLKALPQTQVHTRAEIAKITRDYWEQRTGVGFILGLGASVGFIVGMVVVGQILYASVIDHLREFGTLKAMGASNWMVYRIIIEQALWMAGLGYVPSMALCIGLGAWTQAARGIMILIEPTTAASVLVLTIVMCVGSAVFAVQKVTRVDPAIVFKA